MPNHYTTDVTLRGGTFEVTKFRTTHFVTENNKLEFDFNTVIPMPKCLEGIESSSIVWDGIEALTKDPTTAWKYIAEKWGTDALVMVQKAMRAKEECGYTDWYGWCKDKWGTKWNAYGFVLLTDRMLKKPRIHKLHFTFQTAWCPPMPILNKLMDMYSTLAFTIKGRDEFESKWSPISRDF